MPENASTHSEHPCCENEIIRFGRCLCPGIDYLHYTHQEYVWLKTGKLTHPSQVTGILDVWGLDPPSLIINLCGGWYHPRTMVQANTLRQRELQEVLNHARQAVGLLQMREPNLKEPPCKEEEQLLIKTLGEALEARLVDAFVALVDACAQTNSWMILDQAFCFGQQTYLLELALGRTESRPVILVFVDQCAEQFRRSQHPGDQARPEHDEAWDLLSKHARAVTENSGAEHLDVVKLPDALFGKPWDELWPPFETDCKPSMVTDHQWGQWFFRCATHIMIREHLTIEEARKTNDWTGVAKWGSRDRSAMAFPASWLGPVGHVFSQGGFGGGWEPDFLILRAIQRREPAVILKQTGMCSDFYGHVIEIVLDSPGRKGVDEVVKELQHRYPPFVDGLTGCTYDMSLTECQVYTLLRGMVRVPLSRLRSSTVVMNVWTDSPKTTLKRLSACFSATLENLKQELGAEGTDDAAVLAAWRDHAVLEHNCEIFRARANRLTIGGLVLSFFSTVLAVIVTYAHTQTWAAQFDQSPYAKAAKVVLTALPACAGLAITLLSRMRYVAKWASTHMAKVFVESEIYKFRARALEYDPTRVITITKDKNGKTLKKGEEQYEYATPGSVREHFVLRTQEIYHDVMHSDVQQDGLDQPLDLESALIERQEAAISRSKCRSNLAREGSGFGPKGTADESPRKADFKKEPHGGPTSEQLLLSSGLHKSYGSVHAEAKYDHKSKGDASGQDPPDQLDDDDLFNILSNDEYFHHRVMPNLEYYRAAVPQWSARLRTYELGIFVASVAGTLLGALQFIEWIPIAVAVSAVLTSLVQYEGLHSRISATNAAVEDLVFVERTWHSNGVIQQRSRQVMDMMVTMTEHAIIREAQTYTHEAIQATSKLVTTALAKKGRAAGGAAQCDGKPVAK